MRDSRILQTIHRGRTAFATTLHLRSADVYEMIGQTGFDGIWMDLEHHPVSDPQAAELIRAARAGGTDVIARPGNGEYQRMARLLEAGAAGIMYPRCHSAEDARQAVRWAKFAPVGQRGCDGSNVDADFGSHALPDYLNHAQQQTFLIVQIEDPHALDCIAEIAAVPGVDFLMLGPGDYSIQVGVPGQIFHPLVAAAQQQVADAATAAGLPWAATSVSVEHACQLAAQGASLIFAGCDLLFVRDGLNRLSADLRKSSDQTRSDG